MFFYGKEILAKETAYTILVIKSGKEAGKMIRKYFAGANTSSGYVELFENNLSGMEKIYGFSGKSKGQKTEVMKIMLSNAEAEYKNIECVMNPFSVTDIDAVIIRDTKTAIVDVDVYMPKKLNKTIDFEDFNGETGEGIQKLLQKQEEAKKKFYKAYADGKVIHDDWEKIYIKNMHFERFNAYQDGVIIRLFPGKSSKIGTQKHHRFFGASTPDGSVNYIDNLTENLNKRYFIKGRPGTGKSTFLRRIAKRAEDMGYDTEIYYCSFDKDSLDMVIVPELGFCVFDSTAPHEMFPESDRDVILDFYTEAGLSGTDERHKKELEEIAHQYKHKMAEGMAYLRLCKLYMKEFERLITRNTDEKEFENFKEKTAREILGT